MKEKSKTPNSRKAANAAVEQSANPECLNQYMARFVNNTENISPEHKGKATEIAAEHVRRIRRINLQSKEGAPCSVKAFVNNVLADHFERYADIINKIIES